MKNKELILKSLEICQNPTYVSENAGRYVAKVQYHGSGGEIALVLDPDAATELLAFVGPLIQRFAAKAAQEVAQNIEASIAASGGRLLDAGHVHVAPETKPE